MRLVPLLLLAALSAQAALVKEVRAAINAGNLDAAAKLVEDHRRTAGITPETLLALSWIGRGAQSAKDWDRAEAVADETKKLAVAELRKRKLDAEGDLPLALGAAIEVKANVMDARGERAEAVAYLRRELATYRGTSIRTRIQKNIHLLSLEGKPAPAIESPLWIGRKPEPVAALKGKVALLFFWAHWCGDCKRQGPILERLLARYGPQGFTIVAPTQRYGYVARGEDATPEQETPYIAQVLKEHYGWMSGLPVPVSEANFKNYGASTTPTLVIVDRRGIVRHYRPGNLDEAMLDEKIRSLLAERADKT